MTVALDEDLKSKIEIPKDEDNQLQTALEVFDEGVDAVNEKISAENGGQRLRTMILRRR